MSLSFVLAGLQIKRFKTVVKSLAAIGSELLVEALPEKLILRAINSAHSAFLAVSLSSNFFESYNVFSQRGVVQSGVLIKHLLATFRSTRVSSLSCELNEEQASLKVTLRCENGLLKRYGLDVNTSDILQANLDSASLPVSVVAEAAELNKLLNTFQSTLDEVSIIALPTQHSIAATGPQGQAAAQRYVRLQSFYDPAKAAGSKALHTSMSLDTSHVFKSYSNSCSSPSDVTINLKDLKALVGLCVELGADVELKFDEAGVPLLAVPHAAGVQALDYTAELILSTLQESVNPPDGEHNDWQQPDPAAAAAAAGADENQQQQQQGQGAAERAETIAPATTMVGGAAAVARGGAAVGDTPQGGVGGRAAGSGSVLQFRQAAAPSDAAAGGVSGGGGGVSGGRSGGRARSGGGSRFEKLEADLAEQEALQQQQHQYMQQYRQQQQQQQYNAGGGVAGGAAAAAASAGGAEFVTPASRLQQQQEMDAAAAGGGGGGIVWPTGDEDDAGDAAAADDDDDDDGGQGYEDAGQHSLGSLDEVEALPGLSRRHSRSPAPAVGIQHGQQQQQQQQQQQPWGHMQQHQQQQEEGVRGVQPGGFGSEAVVEGGGGFDQAGYGDMEGVEGDDEELPATPPASGLEDEDMEQGGLGEL